MWSEDVVKTLNEYQTSGKFHPYTCGTPDCGRTKLCVNWRGDQHEVFFRSELVATTNGWICPNCDYTQDWYH